MSRDDAAAICVGAAKRKLRNVRERLFPPTWVEALRQIKGASSRPAAFAPTARDLLHELLIPTPNAMHSDDPEEDFQTWFFYRHEFEKLLRLHDSMSGVIERLNLSEPSEADFPATFDLAARILDSSGDHDIAIICLDAAAKDPPLGHGGDV